MTASAISTLNPFISGDKVRMTRARGHGVWLVKSTDGRDVLLTDGVNETTIRLPFTAVRVAG